MLKQRVSACDAIPNDRVVVTPGVNRQGGWKRLFVRSWRAAAALGLSLAILLTTLPVAAQGQSLALGAAGKAGSAPRGFVPLQTLPPGGRRALPEDLKVVIQRTTDVAGQKGAKPVHRERRWDLKKITTDDESKVAELKSRHAAARAARAEVSPAEKAFDQFPHELLSIPAVRASAVCVNARPWRRSEASDQLGGATLVMSGAGDAPLSQLEIIKDGKLFATAQWQWERREDSWDLVRRELLTPDGSVRDVLNITRLGKNGRRAGGVLPNVACDAGNDPPRFGAVRRPDKKGKAACGMPAAAFLPSVYSGHGAGSFAPALFTPFEDCAAQEMSAIEQCSRTMEMACLSYELSLAAAIAAAATAFLAVVAACAATAGVGCAAALGALAIADGVVDATLYYLATCQNLAQQDKDRCIEQAVTARTECERRNTPPPPPPPWFPPPPPPGGGGGVLVCEWIIYVDVETDEIIDEEFKCYIT